MYALNFEVCAWEKLLCREYKIEDDLIPWLAHSL